ncbi:unnamed protein product [Dibothriocephalus latus]|uniref:Uncharacterized protein n=1 Tax=Dibothriocephalus latus TaxID=60516 RepID=A0A3P7MLJ2_DIBLA|nr:unnamed protein product [Dibothriocephalus latus]
MCLELHAVTNRGCAFVSLADFRCDTSTLLNDRGLPSKGGRIIELPAELQCTIGVVYSPLPGQQWHFGELQLRVDSPSRVHSKVSATSVALRPLPSPPHYY